MSSVVRRDVSRGRVEEWALVLTAVGLSPSVEQGPDGFALLVESGDASEAEATLAAYDLENASARRPPDRPDRIGEVDRLTAGSVSALLIAFFLVTGPRDPSVPWFSEGAADATRILSGELWRTLTALCLHADLPHVLANALFGAVFLAAVSGAFGPGLGLVLTLAAGAAGNLANAIFQGPGHVSVGASTAVFAAVGLLAGRGVAQRIRRGELGLRVWVPFAAGVALLSMIGTGERSDIWAHGFGFLSGGFLGIPASLAWRPRAGWPWQVGALLLAAAALLRAWHLALLGAT
jgi:membrane associated rhomboid family serine protease